MQQIQYAAPRSIDEAVRLLTDAGDEARLLAGGTDLLIQLRDGARPEARVVVDAKRIPDLERLEWTGSELRIGATVSCARLTRHPVLASVFPGLVEAAGLIGSRQIQSRATLGGNLCNGSPAADTIPALIALGASAVVAGATGRRTIRVEDFVVAPGRTTLSEAELLVEIVVPAPATLSADAYQRFIPRNEMDIAVVGVGASVALEGNRCVHARIALGAVGPTPILARDAARALVGREIDDDTLGAVAAAAMDAARPVSDKRGSAEFRRRLVGVLTRRVVAGAARRAAARRPS